MISAFGTNLGKRHDFLTVDVKFIFKEISVPKLEQGHIKTDMRRVESAIYRKLQKHSIKVFDIIDIFQNNVLEFIMNSVLFQ